jgi:hypothetical protein
MRGAIARLTSNPEVVGLVPFRVNNYRRFLHPVHISGWCLLHLAIDDKEKTRENLYRLMYCTVSTIGEDVSAEGKDS